MFWFTRFNIPAVSVKRRILAAVTPFHAVNLVPSPQAVSGGQQVLSILYRLYQEVIRSLLYYTGCTRRSVGPQSPGCIRRSVGLQYTGCIRRLVGPQSPGCIRRSVGSKSLGCTRRSVGPQSPGCIRSVGSQAVQGVSRFLVYRLYQEVREVRNLLLLLHLACRVTY